MRFSTVLNLGLIAAGAAASVRTLRRRHAWEQSNQRAYIVLDYDDALSVSTRAGLPLAEFLHEAHHHGATHMALPELTLSRLMAKGRLAVVAPAVPLRPSHGPNGWTYLASADVELLGELGRELAARVPGSQAQLLPEAEVPTLAMKGDLTALAEMGLGFEAKAAAEAVTAGLGVVPRPVSFAWPEDHLVERTLAQAAGLALAGAAGERGIVAFDGDLILGHEMHLEATVAALMRHGLSLAYFCETRHQKGDWFVAKRLAPLGQVILSHYFTPAAMVPEDFHSAAHHWGMLAQARSIRLCYVNVFRRIHATDPLECLHYIEHIKEELEEAGLHTGGSRAPIEPTPQRNELALAALAPAGAAALAASSALGLDDSLAVGLTVLAAAGAAALPYLDRPRGDLEKAYPPSYAPKLLALAGAAAAPAAAAMSGNLLSAALVQAGTAAAIGALTTGRDYQLRIETYRSLNLDWAAPLAAVAVSRLEGRWKWLSLAAVGAAWLAVRSRTPDLLGQLDQDLPAGHTHHLSAAQRMIGDTVIALGPRPGRKWAGLGLAGLGAASLLERLGQDELAAAAALVATVANALMLAAFRRPERPLAMTVSGVGRSLAVGGTLGAGLDVMANYQD
jgi:Family of unknown function (DUF5693)